MTNKLTCEHCQDQLFDFQEGRLSPESAAAIDDHLKSCGECSAMLNDIWQMNLVATRWQDQAPHNYFRDNSHAVQRTSWRFPELFATAASVLAMVLVLTDASVDTSNGIALRFGGSDNLSMQHFEAYQQEQTNQWNQRLDDMANQLATRQVASDQLVLRSVLQASREERREELNTLVNYWTTTQAQQYRETEENLRFLLASQAEDEKDIQQLSNAFRQINVQNSNNM